MSEGPLRIEACIAAMRVAKAAAAYLEKRRVLGGDGRTFEELRQASFQYEEIVRRRQEEATA